MILAFSGRKSSGKSALADEFEAQYVGITRLSFAEPLKQAFKPLFLFSDKQLYGEDKEAIDPRWGVSPRWAMQHLATDFLRDQVHKDFFLKHMDLRLESLGGEAALVLVDDVRFANEQQLLKKHGALLIHIVRDGGEKDAHSSENSLDKSLFDAVLQNDSTLATLSKRLHEAIKRHGRTI
jgi:hypothetical protein|tara:strand:- start:282 stop:821 length:540 start_codon:yes stop_codon:yes gene_type:complete